MDDLFLIKQVTAGNRDAFKFLVIRYQRPIFKFLSSFSMSAQQIEEIAQEAFVKAYDNLSTYHPDKGATFSSWLFTIAKNLSINALAKHSQLKEVVTDPATLNSDACLVENQHAQLEAHEQAQAIQGALGKLPEEFRNAVVFSYFKDLSLEEIASIENCSIGTVKSRVFRGKQLLKSLLAKVVEA